LGQGAFVGFAVNLRKASYFGTLDEVRVRKAASYLQVLP